MLIRRFKQTRAKRPMNLQAGDDNGPGKALQACGKSLVSVAPLVLRLAFSATYRKVYAGVSRVLGGLIKLANL